MRVKHGVMDRDHTLIQAFVMPGPAVALDYLALTLRQCQGEQLPIPTCGREPTDLSLMHTDTSNGECPGPGFAGRLGCIAYGTSGAKRLARTAAVVNHA